MSRTGSIDRGKPLNFLMRREMAAFLPAIGLAAFWFGGAATLFVSAIAVIVGWTTRPRPGITSGANPDNEDGCAPPGRADIVEMLERGLLSSRTRGLGTACLVLGFDDTEALRQELSSGEFDAVIRRTTERLSGALRCGDGVACLPDARFAIALCPAPHPDLESMIQLAGRLQSAAESPLSIGGGTVTISTYVGFCLMGRSGKLTGISLLEAAETAADEARRNAPSAIRAYGKEMRRVAAPHTALAEDIADALAEGQIVPFFQPQLCTDTGKVSGMQAFPRWLHPERGTLTEEDIIAAVEASGLPQRFTEVMFFQCFQALRLWGRAGESVGPVSLTVSQEMIRNPRMADRLRWECDRFELTPNHIRLMLDQHLLPQIDDEVVARNLAACHATGCQIELAGFGVSNLSVAAIRRSSASRLRIHRSLVSRIDTDPEQHRTVAAIISLADGLGLETLAEGVRSIGQHATLAQLGCRYVQGEAIAPPMLFEDTLDWGQRHRAKLRAAPQVLRRQG